jgi:hypothetical protein
MADSIPEAVAFTLFGAIARSESYDIGLGQGGKRPTREWILRTYATCLRTVQQPAGIDIIIEQDKAGVGAETDQSARRF